MIVVYQHCINQLCDYCDCTTTVTEMPLPPEILNLETLFFTSPVYANSPVLFDDTNDDTNLMVSGLSTPLPL